MLDDLDATARHDFFPVCRDATMSMVPHQAQTSAAPNSSIMLAPIARPIGDGGVSTISRAAAGTPALRGAGRVRSESG